MSDNARHKTESGEMPRSKERVSYLETAASCTAFFQRVCLHCSYLHRRQSAAMASVTRIARATNAADRLLLLWMLALGRKTSSQRAPV